MSKSNGVENDTLTYWLTADAVTIPRPTSWYVALFITDASEDGSGTEVTLSEDASYARKASTFNAPVDGVTANAADVAFDAVVLVSSAYNIVGFAVFDALTAGNMLYYGNFASSKNITGGEELTFSAGDLIISED